MAATWTDVVDQGADFRRVIWYEDTAGVYLDLTGYTFEAELRRSHDPADAALATFTCTIITNPESSSVAGNEDLSNRALELTLTNEQTELLADGNYTFELWSVSPAGVRECDFAGVWTVNARGVR